MKKNINNVLIVGATSDMAQDLLLKLLDDDVCVYAASRSDLNINAPNLKKIHVDASLKSSIENLFNEIQNVEFDAVICFQGVAIVSPVEFLSSDELQKQFDISIYSLLEILKGIKGKIKKDGVVINLSSMSSFGIYPFLAPYSMAKAASDILLNCYEMETGIKTVSIKPGVVSTKFWKYCINENKSNFTAFRDEYKIIGEFLKSNALKNANKGIKPEKVSKLIYKILHQKNPKSSYTIGKDSKLASFVSFFKGRKLFGIIRKVLFLRVKEYLNGR